MRPGAGLEAFRKRWCGQENCKDLVKMETLPWDLGDPQAAAWSSYSLDWGCL